MAEDNIVNSVIHIVYQGGPELELQSPETKDEIMTKWNKAFDDLATEKCKILRPFDVDLILPNPKTRNPTVSIQPQRVVHWIVTEVVGASIDLGTDVHNISGGKRH